MTESKTTIESVLQEQRVFEPPADVSANARISSLEAYRALADSARQDPDAFWGEAARKELHCSSHSTRFSIGPIHRLPVGSKVAPPTSPSTASTVTSRARQPTRPH